MSGTNNSAPTTAPTTLGAAAASLTVFSLMLSDFFDTAGTVDGVGQEARYVDAEGNDSLAASAARPARSPRRPTSRAPPSRPGRTGLTSVVTAFLFGACLFHPPLAGVVPRQATGAVLVLVGFLMMRDVGSLP